MLLQRFPQFGEQPRVFDRDDSLGGKARNQLHLLVGKGTNFLTEQGERTHHLVLLQHRNKHARPRAAQFDGLDGSGVASVKIAWRCGRVRHLNGRLRRQHASNQGVLFYTTRCVLARLNECRRRIVCCQHVQSLAVPAGDNAELGLADADGVLQHGGKYRLQIAGGAGDNLEHLGGSGLLL